MLRQGLLLLFFVKLSFDSWAIEPFKSIELPAEHTSARSISLKQGPNGQIWLFSDANVSLFTSNKFILYHDFNLPQPIRAGVVFDPGFVVATEQQVVFQSKLPPHQAHIVWQSQAHNPIGIEKFKDTLLIVADEGLFQLPSSQLTAQTPEKIAAIPGPVKSHFLAGDTLYLLTETALTVVQLEQGLSKSYPLRRPLNKMVVLESTVFAIDQSEQLVEVNLANGRANIIATGITASAIHKVKQQLYWRSNHLWFQADITQLKAADYSADKPLFSRAALPVTAEYISLDQDDNMWLFTPYDVQVLWRQNISLTPFPPKALAPFDLVKGDHALRGSEVFVWHASTRSWHSKGMLTDKANYPQLIVGEHKLWLIKEALTKRDRASEKHLVALNKETLETEFEVALDAHAEVLKVSQQSVLVINRERIVEVTESGQQSLVKSCQSSCLPSYKIHDQWLEQEQIWLATDAGLHHFDIALNEFSEHRFDHLNALNSVVSIGKYDDHQYWLIYPDKIALFDAIRGTSELYYSEHNRFLNFVMPTPETALVFSQYGWFQLARSAPNNRHQNQLNLHKLANKHSEIQYLAPETMLQLTANQQELSLAFNVTKQHAKQALYLRFKYEDETTWSQASQLVDSITLKDLRQGKNSLLMEARLEGEQWRPGRTLHYQMPYKYLQTKWVLLYGILVLFMVALVYLVERYKRFRVVFDTLKKQTFIDSLLESTKDGVWVADQTRAIRSVNQAFADITGFSLNDVQGRSFQIVTAQGRDTELERLIWQEVEKVGFWTGEVWSQGQSGEALSIDLSVTRVETKDTMSDHKDVRFVGVFSDVTNRKQSEKALRQLATRDPLTDLANRTLYIELVEQCIASANPVDPAFALVFIDLDNFSKVNANLGPLQGDQLIKQVADRLSNMLEKGISIARLTADEFALILPHHLCKGDLNAYIRRLAGEVKRQLQPSFQLANTEVNISASMGISLYPQHGLTCEALMRCADTALKKVKRSGRNNFIVYAKELEQSESEVLSLESELIRAFDNDEFKVFYQPKYLVQQHLVSGYEALVRWYNPSRGIVPPDQFITLAEQNGLIRQLDSSVLKKVCQQIIQWQQQGVEFGQIAVNISALNFQQMEFCQTIQDIVAEYGVEPKRIELEITESAMMSDPEQTLANLNELRSLGFTIALDDFGTGHSSLGHLKYFPIDRIKIDRSFVKDIETSELAKNITSVIIQLAKHLNMKIIAEGVENQSQAYILHILGCNEIQGYLISKPLPQDKVVPFLQEKMADLPDISLD